MDINRSHKIFFAFGLLAFGPHLVTLCPHDMTIYIIYLLLPNIAVPDVSWFIESFNS